MDIYKLDFWIFVGGGAILLLVALALLRLIGDVRSKGKVTPGLQAVMDAFMPYVYRGIFAGERAVIWGFDALEEKIDSTDKARVADAIYALLPDTLVIGGIPIPSSLAKKMIPKEEFQRLIANTYDEVNAFLTRNEDYLKGRIDALKIPPEKAAGTNVSLGIEMSDTQKEAFLKSLDARAGQG